jgi:hypothetical protein
LRSLVSLWRFSACVRHVPRAKSQNKLSPVGNVAPLSHKNTRTDDCPCGSGLRNGTEG